MGSNSETNCQQNVKKNWGWTAARDAFQILTTTLLSLLLPLSFLLLARLSTARYLLSVSDNYPATKPISLLWTLFLYTKPTILHLLLSLLSVAALTHGLTGKVAFLRPSVEPVARPGLHAAWVFLCAVQVCVGLGIEGSIAAGIDSLRFDEKRNILCRVIFFFGLHETMLFWSRNVVKPVVDDTVFGCSREEKWIEKVVMTVTFAGLWWWRLRDEVDPLVVVAEIKRELMISVGMADFMDWWLYYLTVTTGVVRVVKGLVWIVTVLVCRRVQVSIANDEKV
ncbi:unnamed protein product [Fraxinus pennsylvanica]|uniref:Transmembrane protein n=1 Tax=Fraxinus pennsylvanica TaxID=56036 RepID=A0AAD2DUI4_9LAMI|nr:unnamed protein product [Fraxinus pennsylvanica]